MNYRISICVIALAAAMMIPRLFAEAADGVPAAFAKENLVAWCIVPFDAKHRGPAERAEMIKRLGLHRVAYDWRQEHVPTFEQEILQYKKHGIEYFAFWGWHEDMEPLIRKYGIKPQIWITCAAPDAGTQDEKIKAAADALLPLVGKTKELGLQLGLYNHGGWGGEPANMVAVCEYLREHHDARHVGIVYNFHHGHSHITDFAESLQEMKPYLLCVNINGMAEPIDVEQNAGKNKIVPVGSGVHEQKMIQTVIDSGYSGPIGVLGHRADMDAEEALRLNLNGLSALLKRLP